MYQYQNVQFFAHSQTVKTEKILKPFWELKKQTNPKNKVKKRVKFVIKWTKFILYAFIFIIALWGCFQQFGQSYTTPSPTVGQGLEFGYNAGTTGDWRYDLAYSGSGNYWTFSDYSLTYGPFIAWFVYPLAKVALAISYFFSPSLSYGGFGTLFTIIIILLFMRLLVFWPSLKTSFLAEKSNEHRGALDEINAKYANIDKSDKAAKMRKQQEIQAYNKKHNLNPLGQLEATFTTIPVFLTILKLFGILRPVKATVLFGIWALSEIPFNAIFQNFSHGGWVYIFLMLIVIPVQVISQKLPLYFAKKRNRNARAISQKGQEQAKKQARIQNIMMVVFIAFPLFVSSGIGVYYFFSGMITIAQNLIIHKIIEKRRKSGFNIDDYLARFGISKTEEELGFFQKVFFKN